MDIIHHPQQGCVHCPFHCWRCFCCHHGIGGIWRCVLQHACLLLNFHCPLILCVSPTIKLLFVTEPGIEFVFSSNAGAMPTPAGHQQDRCCNLYDPICCNYNPSIPVCIRCNVGNVSCICHCFHWLSCCFDCCIHCVLSAAIQ